MSDPRNQVGAKIGFGDARPFPAMVKLMADIEREFLCNTGPARAYFELCADRNAQAEQFVFRACYQTIAVAVAKPMTPETVAELCDYVWKRTFVPAIAAFGNESERDDRMLFWRKTPVVGYEDGFTKFRARLIVPGIKLDLEKFEGGMAHIHIVGKAA